jgi:WD40 repeat protein
MNTNLLKALKEIISQNGGIEIFSDARRVKALLSDLAAGEPRPQKNALIFSLERGFAAPLKNARAAERGQVKAELAERLNREEGLDAALCADTLDLLEAALFGEKDTGKGAGALPGGAFCPVCGVAAAPGKPAPSPRKAAPKRSAAPSRTELWRELRSLEGHTDLVTSVAYSPGGNRIASGSFDKTIRIWDAESGRELHTLEGHTSMVFSVAYSPGGGRIASGSGDETIKIWDAESGRELRTLKGDTYYWVYSVAYSPGGNRIASGANEKTIRIWDAESGRELHTLEVHTGMVRSVAYSPDGGRIASASWDNTIRIWDAESGRELLTLKGHTNVVYSVAYSPGGNRIASGSGDNTIKIWDAG